eukprot:TRINITY_DN3333_c0_g1_i2.p1 TRINITY_DN3333_c0_g1~~TRINITY_DN3333_c0_g1_i2.p1  ORF type:complete len:463 (+),score=120.06 TRINITY_DN3333_c0_g1_i2:55-1389(+)
MAEESGSAAPLLEDASRDLRLVPAGSDQQKGSSSPQPLGFAVVASVLATVGSFTFGYAVGFTSPALLPMTRELQLTRDESALVSSLLTVGAMVGAVSAGSIADAIGRRAVLGVAATAHVLGWGAIAVAETFLPAAGGRIVSGFGVGLVSFGVPVYIAEVAPEQQRGALGTLNQVGITVGILGAYSFGLLISSSFSWRWLAFVGMMAGIILLLSMPILPETPRWLAQHGKEAAVTESLKKLRGASVDVAAEAEAIFSAVQGSVNLQRAAGGTSWASLADAHVRMPLLISLGIMIFQQLGGINALLFYADVIFAAAGMSTPGLASFFVAVAQVCVMFITVPLMDHLGRRPLLLFSGSGMAISCFILGLCFYLQSAVEGGGGGLSWVVSMGSLVGFVLYIVTFSLGFGPIPWLIMSEVTETSPFNGIVLGSDDDVEEEEDDDNDNDK